MLKSKHTDTNQETYKMLDVNDLNTESIKRRCYHNDQGWQTTQETLVFVLDEWY